jgi:hypothetical protein
MPLLALVLTACGEKVQTIPVGSERKADGQTWQNTDSRYLAPGWTAGDESSWNAQLANRAQAQNDYAQRK